MYTPFHKLHDTIGRAFERHDLRSWQHQPAQHPPIYGFYHIYCDKDWERMVNEQVSHLIQSGLLEQTITLFVSCILLHDGDEAKLHRIFDRLTQEDGLSIEYVSVSRDASKFEYPALEALRDQCIKDDCLVYYFHTKGITYQNITTTDKRFNAFKRNIEAWRYLMEYFLMDQWWVAVNTLQNGYDTYGCYRLPPPPKAYYLYAGNFWWSTSDYVKRLPAFDPSIYRENRYYAEEWLYKAHPHDFSAFDTMADLYYVYLPPSLYHNEKPPLGDSIKFVWLYNIRKFRKQILGYDYKAHYQKKYQKLRQ